MESTLAEDFAVGLENLRVMFRVTMARTAEPGETIEECRARIAADPATREVAKRLQCSVEELMTGFGTAEELEVDLDYDHDAATKQIDSVVTAVAEQPIGSSGNPAIGDRVVAGELRHAGAHAAPHAEAPRGKVLGGGDNAELVKRQLMSSMSRPRAPVRALAPAKAGAR